VRWLVADVGDRGAVADAFRTVRSESGRLDVVVSNAGIARHATAPDLDPADLETLLATNVAGFFHLLACAVPLLRESGGGSIVAVSSVHAVATAPLVSAYAATKAAIVAAVRGAALDHAPDGIRVNAVLPGSVDTPMLRASAARRYPEDPDRAVREWGARHPLGRVLHPDELAAAIVFLSGPEASGITGTALAVDGGLLAALAI
jgi:NAD(P)-dependent dehydrogenase (short-subunit alcohol dehydrogenase family)